MKITSLIFDMDGTILNDAQEITEKTKEILIRAQQKGIKVLLASARPINSMESFAKELKMDEYESYILSYNGAKIMDCKTREIVFSQVMFSEEVETVYDYVKEKDLAFMVDDGETLWTNKKDFSVVIPEYFGDEPQNIAQYESRDYQAFEVKEFHDFSEISDIAVPKILLGFQPEVLDEMEEDLLKAFSGKLSASRSAPIYFEYTHKDVDKGKSIVKFLSTIGLDVNEAVAFGDGHNDVSMLEAVGCGVAMGNAQEEVKEIADFVTDSNENEGIWAFLKDKI